MLWRFPLKKYIVGRCTGKVAELLENSGCIIVLYCFCKLTRLDMTLDLMGENGAPIVSRLRIKLTLISESPQVFMESVDADIVHLNSDRLAAASSHIDTAISVAQTGSAVVQTLGNCVRPLGQALQLIVKIMDNIADVCP
jgi:hypothetical protein